MQKFNKANKNFKIILNAVVLIFGFFIMFIPTIKVVKISSLSFQRLVFLVIVLFLFVDFDLEVQERMVETISKIKGRHFNDYGFRDEVSHILSDLLQEYKDNVVIAMPPSGMYWQYLRKI